MSLIDRILGAPCEAPPEMPRGIILRRGRLIPRIGGLLAFAGRPAAAVTLGRNIILNPRVPITPRLLRHELAHVRQWRADRWFPIRYALATLRHGYWNNPFEVEARAAEGDEPS